MEPIRPGPALVSARGLVKVYPTGVRAVAGIDLAVGEGEIFGLLGPNGAGKTTTIKMIVTLEAPTEGTVTVAGHDVVDDPDEVRRALGYASQEVAVDRLLTSRENLSLFGSLYHLSRLVVEERTRGLLSLFELEGRADEPVSGFSGGMKKRLDIACGLIHRPRLLVLDEPTLGLDIQTRHRIWDHVRALRQAGATLILTTHYLEEADRLCDRVAIIDHGRIQVEGPPAALKTSIGAECLSLSLADPDRGRVDAFLAQARALPHTRDLIATDDTIEVLVTRGDEAIPPILGLADRVGLSVRAMTFTRPTLDDVFLRHTGYRMREA